VRFIHVIKLDALLPLISAAVYSARTEASSQPPRWSLDVVVMRFNLSEKTAFYITLEELNFLMKSSPSG
jgi:hypothetical protein